MRAVAVLTAAVLVVSGCTAEADRMAVPRPDPDPHPVVTETQAEAVLAEVDRALAAGIGKQDVKKFGPRVTGPYRTIAKARFLAEKRRKTKAGKAPVVSDVRWMVTRQKEWPRFFFAAGKSSAAEVPVLRVMLSEGAREPYALWSELSMVPGATMPTTVPVTVGADPVPADAEGLLMTPTSALAKYAKVLTVGPNAKEADFFGADEFRGQIAERLIDDRKALKSVVKKITDRHVADPKSILALRTSDGGALVVGVIEQTYVITLKTDAGKITPHGSFAGLTTRTSFTKKLTRTSLEVVALSVPKTGGGVVRLIAAQKADVKLVGS